MGEVRKIENFEVIIKITAIIILFVHLIYLASFSLTDIGFHKPILIKINLIQTLIALIFAYFVIIKNKLYLLATIFAHLDVLFTCCYCIYILGWGYGFQMIIVLLLSLSYLQTFNSHLIPLGIAVLEIIMFFVMFWVTKNTPDFYNEFMPYINIANFLFMVVTVLIYIWLSDKGNDELIKKLDIKNEELKYKSEFDYLTNLLNRRALNEVLEDSIIKLKDKKIKSLAIAIGDIDNFKNLNDTYGHNFGDLILKNISATLTNQYKKMKNIYVSRWGGEEFLIIYIDYDFNEVLNLLEKTRQNIEKLKNNDGLNMVNTTISFGLSYANNDTNKDLLITKADFALYNAKHTGKNKIQSVKLG